jgi:Cupin-like domain
MHVIAEVPRVGRLSRERFLADYVAVGKPVVITDLLSSWPALDKWTAPYIAELLGERVFQFKSSTSEAHPDFRRPTLREMFAREAMTFADFVRLVTQGEAAERARWLFSGDEHFLWRKRDGVAALNPELAPLWPDVCIPDLLQDSELYSVWAWFSGAGVRTWLHYDNNGCHNLNAQLRGHKRAWLFAPEELDKLALFPLDGPNPANNCSQIDFDRPDYVRHPEFERAQAQAAELQMGDVLFIPANWLHSFSHHGDWNANVNFWWKPEVELDDPVALRELQRSGVQRH